MTVWLFTNKRMWDEAWQSISGTTIGSPWSALEKTGATCIVIKDSSAAPWFDEIEYAAREMRSFRPKTNEFRKRLRRIARRTDAKARAMCFG